MRLWPREKQHSIMLTLTLRGSWQAAHTYATEGVIAAVREELQAAQADTEAGSVLAALTRRAPLASALQMLQVCLQSSSSQQAGCHVHILNASVSAS
jgi:hypothetical protein